MHLDGFDLNLLVALDALLEEKSVSRAAEHRKGTSPLPNRTAGLTLMNYLPQVVEAHHVSGFVVSARFDDGTEKYIDVSQWFKGPVFEPLKDLRLFKKFFIEGGTLAWPNGVDIAPEALYAARGATTEGNTKPSQRTRPKSARR